MNILDYLFIPFFLFALNENKTFLEMKIFTTVNTQWCLSCLFKIVAFQFNLFFFLTFYVLFLYLGNSLKGIQHNFPSLKGEQNVIAESTTFLFGQSLKTTPGNSACFNPNCLCVNFPIKMCRKSTALLMCHLSPMCVKKKMFVIFNVNDGTFPWATSHSRLKEISLWVLRS